MEGRVEMLCHDVGRVDERVLWRQERRRTLGVSPRGQQDRTSRIGRPARSSWPGRARVLADSRGYIRELTLGRILAGILEQDRAPTGVLVL